MPKLPIRISPKINIKPYQQAFIIAYVANGYNAAQAYISIKPHVAMSTARTEGPALLANPHVRAALDEYITQATLKKGAKNVASREYLTQQAHDIGEEARQSGLYTPALQSVDIKAKLHRLYDRDAPDTEAYTQIMQQFIQVNVTPAPQVQPPDLIPPPIDITPPRDAQEIGISNDINELEK